MFDSVIKWVILWFDCFF